MTAAHCAPHPVAVCGILQTRSDYTVLASAYHPFRFEVFEGSVLLPCPSVLLLVAAGRLLVTVQHSTCCPDYAIASSRPA